MPLETRHRQRTRGFHTWICEKHKPEGALKWGMRVSLGRRSVKFQHRLIMPPVGMSSRRGPGTPCRPPAVGPHLQARPAAVTRSRDARSCLRSPRLPGGSHMDRLSAPHGCGRRPGEVPGFASPAVQASCMHELSSLFRCVRGQQKGQKLTYKANPWSKGTNKKYKQKHTPGAKTFHRTDKLWFAHFLSKHTDAIFDSITAKITLPSNSESSNNYASKICLNSTFKLHQYNPNENSLNLLFGFYNRHLNGLPVCVLPLTIHLCTVHRIIIIFT